MLFSLCLALGLVDELEFFSFLKKALAKMQSQPNLNRSLEIRFFPLM